MRIVPISPETSHVVSMTAFSVRFSAPEQGRPEIPGGRGGEIAGRLVSFRDPSQKDLALGIIEEKDEDGERLIIKTPLKEGARYATVVVGQGNDLTRKRLYQAGLINV